MSKRKYSFIIVFLVILCLAAVGLTLAYWVVTTEMKSEVSTGQLSGEIVKESGEEEELLVDFHDTAAREQVKHQIHVKNTGARDIFARVRICGYWASADGTIEEGLDPEQIQLNLNESQHWKYDGSEWYYYTQILEAGEITEEAFMESYEVAGVLDSRYENKKIVIDVEMECLQTEGGAIEDLWGISYAFLGLEEPYQVTREDAPMSVIAFVSPDTGFRYDMVEHDLLMAFQKITPGEQFIQNVELRNEYEEAVGISMYADREDDLDKEDIKLIDKLLTEYMTLTITGRLGTVFYDGPVWIEEEDGTTPVKIDFGSFDLEEEKSAFVTLHISPEIENEYQELQGFVYWVFEASGDEAVAEDTARVVQRVKATDDGNNGGLAGNGPETGDTVQILLLVVCVLSVVLFVLIRWRRHWV